MIRNIRDLGGLTGEGGRKIKKNLLIRSARLNMLDAEDLAWFKETNIDLILDLRTPTEVKNSPDMEVPGATNINFYLQDETKSGLTLKGLRALILAAQSEEERLSLVPDMTDIYKAMIMEEYCHNRFSELIRTIVTHDSGAVLFHCTSGKDRTGMTAAVLCSILGVSREDIYDDYLRSLEHAEWESSMMRDEFIDEGASPELADKLKQFFSLDRTYLDAFFNKMELKYGDVDTYIRKGIGLDEETIIKFKNKVLE